LHCCIGSGYGEESILYNLLFGKLVGGIETAKKAAEVEIVEIDRIGVTRRAALNFNDPIVL